MNLRFVIVALALFIIPFDTVSAVAPGGFVPCEGVECSLCNLVDMVNVIIIWLFGIIFILFGVIAVSAGFGLVTSQGNQVALDAAKTKLSNAVIGLIIVMAAWLLIDTIMKGLMKGADGSIEGWGPWTDVQCQVQTVAVESSPDTAEDVVVPVGGSFGVGGSGLPGSEAASQLQAGGIGDGGNVISYDGLRPVAIEGVIALNEECDCDIVVTEATGGTHSTLGQYTHANGYKLDLRTRDNPELLRFVENEFDLIGQTTSANEPIYQRPTSDGGYQKCIVHSTHLDCQFVPGA